MALKAGIDIGTNTILLLIAEVENGPLRVLEDHVTVVRLGQGVDKARNFHPEAMDRARACFANYARILQKYPGIRVRAAATSGSRDAKNSQAFFQEMRVKHGFQVEVISGEEEARLSLRGALSGVPDDPSSLAVLDIGGGSSEIVEHSLHRFSFEMGCVRLSERFLAHDPATPEEIAMLRKFVQEELDKQRQILAKMKGKKLIGVAGTATYLASAAQNLEKFDPAKVDAHWVSLEEVRELIAKFSPLSSAQRLGMGGMDQGRADVILAGAIILEEILLATNLSGYQASVRGLRYGLVL